MKKLFFLIAGALLSSVCLAQGQGGQKWSLSGNAGGNGDFLGTTNNQPLSIRTNNQERLTVTNNGHVAIGTSSSLSLLSVGGTVESLAGGFKFPDGTVQTSAYNSTLGLGTASNPFSGLYASDYLKVGNNSIFIDEINIMGGGAPENHMYVSDGSGDLLINCADPNFANAGSATANTILNNMGNSGGVGISTDVLEPSVKLHVADGFFLMDGVQSSILFDYNSTSAYGQYGLEYLPASITGSTGGLNFWKPAGSNAGLKNYQMFLNDNGQLGIGVNPNEFQAGYKLFVDDGILAEQVKVALRFTSDWADFVFADDYELRSLVEVKDFIMENHHLPDVPSAEEVVENGINMAEMDATLLQKIEELTLYTIQQQELIEQMRLELDELKSSK